MVQQQMGGPAMMGQMGQMGMGGAGMMNPAMMNPAYQQQMYQVCLELCCLLLRTPFFSLCRSSCVKLLFYSLLFNLLSVSFLSNK